MNTGKKLLMQMAGTSWLPRVDRMVRAALRRPGVFVYAIMLFGMWTQTAPAESPCTFTQLTATAIPQQDAFRPAISGDGTRVVFVSNANLTGGNPDNSQQLFLLDLTTRTTTQLTATTGSSTVQSSPAINATGTRIAFVSTADLTGGNPNRTSQLFLVDTTTGTTTQLTASTISNLSNGTNPVINAAGTRIAFFSRGTLFLVDTTTGTTTQLTGSSGGPNLSPTINAAGTRIVFASTADPTGGNPDRNNELFLLDTSTGTTTQLTATTGILANFGAAPAINGDGTRVAFVSRANLTGGNADGNPEIFLLDTSTGTTTQLTATTGSSTVQSSPAISGDGTRIAFLSSADLTGGNADRTTELFLFDTTTGTTTQLTSTPGSNKAGFAISNLAPAIDAAGTRIVFVSDADLTGGNPDGDPELFLLDTTTGTTTQLTATIDIRTPPMPLSIDAAGTRIAFHSDADLTGGNPDGSDELFLVDTSTGTTTQLTTTTGTRTFQSSPAINAAGTRIAFGSNADLTGGNPDGNFELFVLDTTTGTTTQLTATTGAFNGSPAIDAAGTRIAFHSDADLTGGNPDRTTELFLLDTSTGTTTQLTSTTGSVFAASGSDHAINAAGTRIAFSSSANLTGGNPDGNFELFLFDTTTGTTTQLTSTTGSFNVLPTMNAAGTRIAFLSSSATKGELLLLDTITGAIIQLASTSTGVFRFSAAAINAAGTRFAFVSDADLTGGNPDRNTELFLLDTITDTITQLTSTTGFRSIESSPAIDAVGTRIAFVSHANLTELNADGNPEVFLASCPGVTPVTIDIMPGADPNLINLKSKGVIPVTILTTGIFDATAVDPSTVRFGPSGTEAAPVQSAVEDVNGDGALDVNFHFKTQDTGILCQEISAFLTGKTVSGQPIEGSDAITTVGCK
jgi:Tol biopolymer transport system component